MDLGVKEVDLQDQEDFWINGHGPVSLIVCKYFFSFEMLKVWIVRKRRQGITVHKYSCGSTNNGF